MRFQSLRHIQESRLQPGLPHPARAAWGFLPPLATSFLRSLPALFHAGASMGLTLQGFSPGTEPYLFPGRDSHAVTKTPSSLLLRRRREPGEPIGFRVLLPARVRSRQPTRKPETEPMPSWGCASLGCSPFHAGRASAPNFRVLQKPCLRAAEATRSQATGTTKHYRWEDRNSLSQGLRPFRGFSPFPDPGG
jgi:hypothetical protein